MTGCLGASRLNGWIRSVEAGQPHQRGLEERERMAKYKQKDLGYKRTPTDASYRVEMEDRSVWEVPVQVIVDSRDENYKSDEEDTIGFIRAGTLDRYEIEDWASNNMNWSDVKHLASKVTVVEIEPDWEDGWSNGKKGITGKL